MTALEKLRGDFVYASAAMAAEAAQTSVEALIDAIAVLWQQHREYLIEVLEEAYSSAEVEKISALAETIDVMVRETGNGTESADWKHEPAPGEPSTGSSKPPR